MKGGRERNGRKREDENFLTKRVQADPWRMHYNPSSMSTFPITAVQQSQGAYGNVSWPSSHTRTSPFVYGFGSCVPVRVHVRVHVRVRAGGSRPSTSSRMGRTARRSGRQEQATLAQHRWRRVPPRGASCRLGPRGCAHHPLRGQSLRVLSSLRLLTYSQNAGPDPYKPTITGLMQTREMYIGIAKSEQTMNKSIG